MPRAQEGQHGQPRDSRVGLCTGALAILPEDLVFTPAAVPDDIPTAVNRLCACQPRERAVHGGLGLIASSVLPYEPCTLLDVPMSKRRRAACVSIRRAAPFGNRSYRHLLSLVRRRSHGRRNWRMNFHGLRRGRLSCLERACEYLWRRRGCERLFNRRQLARHSLCLD
jgi:hypothetical protein